MTTDKPKQKARMKPKLHLRREWEVHHNHRGPRRVTQGKVYKVVRHGKHWIKIIDDHGNLMSTTPGNKAWRRVWVWPNGTVLAETE